MPASRCARRCLSRTPRARSPTATASSPISRLRARLWPSLRPVDGRDGRSKTRASMCSRTGAITNRGYHLEHNFGHGKEHLAALLACFNLVAFAIHTVCDLASGAWRHARETLGPRTRFFHNLQALSTYVVFSSWTELLETLAFARPPPRPPG